MTTAIQIIIGVMPLVLYSLHSIARRPPPVKETNPWRWRVWCALDVLAFLTPDTWGGSFKLPGTSSDLQKSIKALDVAKEDNASAS